MEIPMDIRLEPQDAHVAPLADRAVAEGDLQGPHLCGNVWERGWNPPFGIDLHIYISIYIYIYYLI